MKTIVYSAVLLACTSVYAQTTLTLQPDAAAGKDAILHGLASEAGVNYGSNVQFIATAWTFQGNEGTVRSVIDFDLSSVPAGATVTSAYLTLYAWGESISFGPHSDLSGSNACWLQRVTSNWDENSVTWNTQPSSTTANRVALAASTSPTQDYPDINVTALVQDMVSSPSTSFGFMILLQDETYYRKLNFCSSDHQNSAKHPKLVVTYSGVGLNETEMPLAFTVYPNPTKEILNIQTSNSGSELIKVQIVNLQGSVIKEVTSNDSLLSLETSGLSNGVYFVQLEIGGQISSQKIIIE